MYCQRNKFIALERAHEAARLVDRILCRLRGPRRSLRDQGSRAMESVVLNLSEGNAKTGRDKARFFRIALGSSYEANSALRLVAAYGLVPVEEVDVARAKLDEVQRMTWASSVGWRGAKRR